MEVPSSQTGQPVEVKTYFYDEWDFRATDYKPRWCAVRERVLEEGGDDYYEGIMREYAGLVNETQRQFELLRPETFRKIKKLEDGEDVDLDAAIEFISQKKAGHGDVPKIYWRRNKIERDVAVAFLLDMSASTDEEIDKRRPRNATDTSRPPPLLPVARPEPHPGPHGAPQAHHRPREGVARPPHPRPRDHSRPLRHLRLLRLRPRERRVLRDQGPRRALRRAHHAAASTRSRPSARTRMGPAIRHTTWKLEQSDAKARILFLVSDGRPQDHGYGRDRTEKEYAIHDTHKALVEAKHKGIVPFALTVDKEGHDYLGQMCGDMAYEVLGDIELLPSRLPTLYRRLTE